MLDPTKVKECHSVGVGRSMLACRVQPGGRYVAAGGMMHDLLQYEVPSENGAFAWSKKGKELRLPGHKSWVCALAFAPDGKRLYAADYSGRLQAWDFPIAAAQQMPVWSQAAHQGWIRAASISSDGKLLATCGNDLAVRLWFTADGKPVRELLGHSCHVYNVAFHPGGDRLVSGDLQGKIRDWSVADGRLVRELDAKELWVRQGNLQLGGVRSMMFQPDGGAFAVGGMYGFGSIGDGIGSPCVILFDWKTGKRLRLLQAKDTSHRAFVNGIHFHSAELTFAVTGGLDGGVLLCWKGTEEKAFHQHKLPQSAWSLDVFPDRRHFVLAHHDGAVRIYDLTPPTTPQKGKS